MTISTLKRLRWIIGSFWCFSGFFGQNSRQRT